MRVTTGNDFNRAVSFPFISRSIIIRKIYQNLCNLYTRVLKLHKKNTNKSQNKVALRNDCQLSKPPLFASKYQALSKQQVPLTKPPVPQRKYQSPKQINARPAMKAHQQLLHHDLFH